MVALQTVQFLQNSKEGKIMVISVKHGDLQPEWKSTIVTKGPHDFITKYNGIFLKDEV